MIEIKDLLSRFDDIILKGEGKIEVIKNAISFVVGIKIESKDIKIKNNIIYLNIKPIYKNEIFIKQEQIFLRLQEVMGKRTPPNIR